MEEIKAKIDKRAHLPDATEAATDAAEEDASAALDFADWAVGNAKLAALDAPTRTIVSRSQTPSPSP
jgi:hypothetical protein